MALTAPILDTLIVGGGITGLAAAHRLAELGLELWRLVEREPRLGGKITTERVQGYVIEGGPDCFLGAKPGGVEFCRTLGIDHRLSGTSPASRRTYVKRDGRLHELPVGITGLVPSRIRPLMTTSILSLAGRLRAGLELVIPPRRDGSDETLARFVSRRFGRETYEWLVEPLLSGIFAGDGRALSLKATFPQLGEAERRHGSIIRMMLAAGGRASGAGAGASAPRGFVTPRGGLAELVETTVRALPDDAVRTGIGVDALVPIPDGYEAHFDDGSLVRTRTVILAVPAFAAADLVAPFAPQLAAPLGEIPFVSTATVSVAFPAAAISRPLDGYGYVSPRAEGGPVVACTWTSNKFPARVPEGGVLIRFFLGRAGNEGIVRGTDGEIREVIRRELARVHGITTEPSLWRIFRWPAGIPQYVFGHLERLERVDAALRDLPGLVLAGASYRGVGVPDCIVSGRTAADQVTAHSSERVA